MHYSELLRIEINFLLFFYFFIILKIKITIFFIAGTLVFIKRRRMDYRELFGRDFGCKVSTSFFLILF